jgi:hypothetical protein
MKHARLVAFSTALLLVLLSAADVAGAAETFALGASPEIPAAQDTARIQTTRNGNLEIKLAIHHLAPPGRITPGSEVFVVWARGLAPGSEAQNLGALKVDKNLKAKFTATTAMSSFDLFITCEQSQTAPTPAALELLPLHHASPWRPGRIRAGAHLHCAPARLPGLPSAARPRVGAPHPRAVSSPPLSSR